MSETLKRYGWQQIASDAHAWQLLRRELKRRKKMIQRNRFVGSGDYLLDIKKGTWFKFMKIPNNAYCGIVLWRKRNA